jgi:hypothetical protein
LPVSKLVYEKIHQTQEKRQSHKKIMRKGVDPPQRQVYSFP